MTEAADIALLKKAREHLDTATKSGLHALHYDGKGQSKHALALYKRALDELNAGLVLLNDEASNDVFASAQPSSLKAREDLLYQLTQAKEHTLMRHDALSEDGNATMMATEADDADQEAKDAASGDEQAELVLGLEGVQMYLVTPQGAEVVQLSAQAELLVLKVENQLFLQCNEWLYPLISDLPCLRIQPRFYVFTGGNESDAVDSDTAIGILLPNDTPVDKLKQLEQLLDEHATLCKSQPDAEEEEVLEIASVGILAQELEQAPVQQDWDDRISSWLLSGASVLADTLKGAAEIGGTFIRSGGESLRQRLQRPDKDVHIDSRVKASVTVAKEASHVTYRVTAYTVDQVFALAGRAAKSVAPMVSRAFGHSSGSGSGLSKKVVHVAKSGGVGLLTVIAGLEEAGQVLAKEMASESTATVRHKYGDDAAEVARASLDVVGNTAGIYTSLKRVKTKAVAKYAVKRTAVEVLHEHREQLKQAEKDPRYSVAHCEDSDDELLEAELPDKLPTPNAVALASSSIQAMLPTPPASS
eukprot:TRINITY_DN6993_c0_g1_i4.p1 TRINITY_DN6993_c0_g1~~TRINITY_DN6993_c0_g1_i4.p1  ORF type:complete len:530 (+),score=123.32 TRINITY_DN6993_c0_g1_i4:97-1686(+)